MNSEKKSPQSLIVELLKEKSNLKQKVFDNTLEAFNEIRDILKDIVEEINSKIYGKVDSRVLLEFYDKGTFEVELKIAGDILVFNMHTNVFDFPPEHSVKQITYFEENPYRSFSGIISIYNFLADSIKFARYEDLGYLIGRIFVNVDKHYMVEGKRQLGLLYRDYHLNVISKESLKNIVYSAILYTLDFDLLVPPYDSVSILTVKTMLDTINNAKIKTGKRLGFKFYPDNDDIK
jgi:hypothetical protein